MLKMYRIIPLVFILCLFGFTLITVAPVFAQSTQDLENRINTLEELLCSLPQLATEEVCTAKAREIENQDAEQYYKRLRQNCEDFPEDPQCRSLPDHAEMQKDNEREREEKRKPRDKDAFTYGPDGSIRMSSDGKFHCTGYPEIRENPDEPRGVAYAKCKQRFDEAKK